VKFREIFRFEFAYQARRVRTWIYFAILFVVANRLRGGGVNSLFTAAQETLLLGLLWALMAPGVAGSAAARDVETRMHPLVYTAPIRKADYLGGRFLAAFGLNALILLALPLGMLVDFLLPGGKPEIIGPYPPVAYFGAYGFLALPTALTFTAVQFAFAALTRKAAFSYLGTVLFCVGAAVTAGVVTNVFNQPTLGALLDPTARIIVAKIPETTLIEMDPVLVARKGWMLANRLLWVAIALVICGFTYRRFRFEHRAK
jgi:ABC-2 type transport system permease protein